jgi:prevent-host-death family protein
MAPQAHIRVEVGVRHFRDHLSRYLGIVHRGGEVVVTDRGRPVARLVPHGIESGLDRLVAEGLVRPPTRPKTPSGCIRRVKAVGEVASLVAEQRR